MTTLFIIGLIFLGIATLARIIWVALSVGIVVLWAIPTFLILFIGLGLLSPWWPAIIAIIFILLFNKNAKENGHQWM